MFITSDYFLKKSDPIAHVLPGSFLKIAKEMLPYNVTESIDPPCRECAESDCAGTIPSWHAATHANRLDHDLNMFRGCVEQVYQMQIFRSFPGSQRIIGTELCEAYSTIGMVYEGMKRKTEFLCKNDIFIFIQNVVFATFPEMESYVCATFLGLRLRWEEQKLGDTLEYIPWSQDIARRLDLKLSEHLQSVLLKTKDTGMKGSKFQDVWREFEALIPEEWSRMNRQKSKILRNLVKHAHTRSLERNHDHILMLTALLPIIQKFIDDHKFNVPNAELPEAERSPKYVRIFIDKKDNQIVMTEELDRALNLIPSDTQRNPLDNWETIPLKEAYGKSLRIDPTLTFIKVPQDLTTFGEVPTRTPGWTYCKRAVDVLFEVIGDMFFGLQVFQKIEEREEGAAGWELLKSWAKEMEKWFPADVTSTYFMSNHKIEEIRNAAINHFAPLHNVKVPSMMLHFKHLDCTESSRTTLVELDMCHVFPGMEATAEIVDTALKRKIPEIYKCHLMNGVLNCVYIHFFKEFPQLAKFVHNQKGCNRVVSTECCHKTTAVRDNVLPDLHPQGEKIPCNMLDSPLITRRNIQVTIIDELLERSRPYIQEEEIKK